MDPYLLIRETGMHPLLVISRIFGFRNKSKNDNSIKWAIIFLTVTPFPILILHNYRYFIRFYQDDDNKPAILAIMVTIIYRYICSFVVYMYGHYTFEKSQKFLFSLAIAIKKLDPPRRELAVKKIKKSIIGGILFYFVYTLIELNIFIIENAIRWDPTSGIYFQTCQVLNLIYLATIGSFINWCTPLLIIICNILILLIDGHVRDIANDTCPQSISQHQLAHKYMSNIVREGDAVVSLFLLASLSNELLATILCIKSLQADNADKATITKLCILVYIFGFVCLFIIKANYSYKVNEKLQLSLTLTDAPRSFKNVEECSSEHFNYIMYLNEQNMSKAELTYGGIFPVQKTFILTIAGTAVTYAIVLNKLGSS